MTGRTGSFWDRHNKRMQDPEYAARFEAEVARIRAVDAQVNADVDEDGLTPLEQAIAKRLYERWADDDGEMTIRTDPRDVALHLRPVLTHFEVQQDGVVTQNIATTGPAPEVDEAEIQDIIREAYDTHIDLGSPARRGEFVFTAAEVIAARLRGATRG